MGKRAARITGKTSQGKRHTKMKMEEQEKGEEQERESQRESERVREREIRKDSDRDKQRLSYTEIDLENTLTRNWLIEWNGQLQT